MAGWSGTEARTKLFPRDEGAGVSHAAVNPENLRKGHRYWPRTRSWGHKEKFPFLCLCGPLSMFLFFSFSILISSSKCSLVLVVPSCSCRGIGPWWASRFREPSKAQGSFVHQVCKVQFSNTGCHRLSMFSAESHLLSVDTRFFYKCRLLHF